MRVCLFRHFGTTESVVQYTHSPVAASNGCTGAGFYLGDLQMAGSSQSVAPNEDSTIRRAAAGDLGAFNQLVATYQNLAFSVAYRTLQDEDAAADAVQESFIKAFRALPNFQGGSFKSWLIRIVSNSCYDYLRSQRRRAADSLDDFADDGEHTSAIADPAELPQTYVERAELNQLIERGVATLPAEQRLVLVLCDIHGYSYEEIADQTGMPMGTVKSRINRARAKVRDYLLQYPELLPAAFRP